MNYNDVQKHLKSIIILHTKVEQKQLLFFIVAHHSRLIQNVALLNIKE